MNKLKTDGLEMMPTSLETWQFLSDMVTVLGQLGAIVGSGVYRFSEPGAKDFIVWNGEVLPLKTGVGSHLIAKEAKRGVYHQGETHEYYIERWVESCGQAMGSVAASSVPKLPTIIELAENIKAIKLRSDNIDNNLKALVLDYRDHKDMTNPHDVTKSEVGLGNLPNATSNAIGDNSPTKLATAKAVYELNVALSEKIQHISAVPAGLICMWKGKTPPDGWGLCDGQEGRPDLRGRFIVGLDPRDNDYSEIGNFGGESRHILTVEEMPTHNHGFTSYSVEGIGVKGGGDIQFSLSRRSGERPSGGDDSHENRPPYYVLAYIIKL